MEVNGGSEPVAAVRTSFEGPPNYRPTSGPPAFGPPPGADGPPSFGPPPGENGPPNFGPPPGVKGFPPGADGPPSFGPPPGANGFPSFGPPPGADGPPAFGPPPGADGPPSFGPPPGADGPPAFGPPPGAMEIPKAKLSEIVITDYIRESLDKVAASEGFSNYNLDVDHGSSIGDGFVGVMLKVFIREIDSDKELKVLAKIPPQSQVRREMMQMTQLFEREVFVYNVMLPEFVELQREKKIPDAKGFYNFPKVYYADFNKELGDGIIIMEDLRDSGHGMWDKYKAIDLEHTKLLMVALGRLHGISFAMKAKRPELFEKYKALGDYMTNNMSDPNFTGFMQQSIAKTANCLDEDDTKRRAKIQKLSENFLEVTKECMDAEATEPFAVVNHGDCWTNNFLYHYTKRGKPDNIVMIDWQISRYCSPVIDLVYFFYICTDQALRLKHFDELLNVYHNALRELNDSLGGDTMVQFPFTALLRHLKKYARFGVIMSAFIMPMLQQKNEDLMDMDFMAEQMQNGDPAAMEEMMKQYEESLKHNKGYQVYVERMRGVLIDVTNNGYL